MIDVEKYMQTKCMSCEFFDGYDICCYHENLGSVIEITVNRCIVNNIYKEK